MRLATCRATREERRRPMACDLLVPDPILSFTHAIDLDVPPERAWPWLAQMGAGRAGWYSWDLLDNGGRRSADWLVPEELQHAAVGDVFPAVPGAREVFVVAGVDPPRDLVLHWPAADGRSRASWEFRVDPARAGSRLVVRSRMNALGREAAREDADEAALGARLEAGLMRVPLPLLRPLAMIGHRVMQARQLRRAEATHRAPPGRGLVPATRGHGGRAHPRDAGRRAPSTYPGSRRRARSRSTQGRRRLAVARADGARSRRAVQRGLARPPLRHPRPAERRTRPARIPGAPPRRRDSRGADAMARPCGRPRALARASHRGWRDLVSNSWLLCPADPETTRLVFRVRARLPMTTRNRVMVALLGPAGALVMQRAQLRGIRRRAESLALARRAHT